MRRMMVAEREKEELAGSILAYFASIRDPRAEQTLESLSQLDEWHGLQSLVRIETERTVAGQTSTERRHFISSCKSLSATAALDAARRRWGIENGLHWVLDVVFREDDCRVRAGYAAENFAVMRHLSLNLLKSLKDTKLTVKLRRMSAAWNEELLLNVLLAHPDVGRCDGPGA